MSEKDDFRRFVLVCNFVGAVVTGAGGGELIYKFRDPQGGVEPDPVISPTTQNALVGLCIRELATTLSDKKSAKQITELANQIIRETAK
jgi:hypothetical protein